MLEEPKAQGTRSSIEQKTKTKVRSNPTSSIFNQVVSFRKRRETNNKSVAKNRARKKEEKEAKEKRMEELRKENQEIEGRTAAHQQVSRDGEVRGG